MTRSRSRAAHGRLLRRPGRWRCRAAASARASARIAAPATRVGGRPTAVRGSAPVAFVDPHDGRGQPARVVALGRRRVDDVVEDEPRRRVEVRRPASAGRARPAALERAGRGGWLFASTTSTMSGPGMGHERLDVVGEVDARRLAALRRDVADVDAQRRTRPRPPRGSRAAAGSAAGSCRGCPARGRSAPPPRSPPARPRWRARRWA